jgi:regulator of protease activity HflC (stomatin/prohibitin superfamily)
MAQQHEIVKVAEAKARRILEEAEAEARERREGADRYAMEALSELEGRLNELLSVVGNGIRSLNGSGSGRGMEAEKGGYRERLAKAE